MLDYICSVISALYTAISAFAASLYVVAAFLPWHASLVSSGLIAAVAAVAAYGVSRIFRGKKKG